MKSQCNDPMNYRPACGWTSTMSRWYCSSTWKSIRIVSVIYSNNLLRILTASDNSKYILSSSNRFGYSSVRLRLPICAHEAWTEYIFQMRQLQFTLLNTWRKKSMCIYLYVCGKPVKNVSFLAPSNQTPVLACFNLW